VEEQPSPKAFYLLTLRRVQVLSRLAEARTEREIAEDLSITLDGVRSHVQSLKEIIGVRTTREIGRWWQENRNAWIRFIAREAGA
jgi:DNA-binding NarL/FixJ family response regulator